MTTGIRHWLIRKLSCGDMIMMNFERRANGSLWPKNLGPVMVHNIDLSGTDDECGFSAGIYGWKAKTAFVLGYTNRALSFTECVSRGFRMMFSFSNVENVKLSSVEFRE